MVVTRPMVTGLVDTLERLGLVTRSAHDSDGRMRLLALTDTGRELVQRVLPEVHRFEEELFSALSPSQQTTLLDLLATLAVRLEPLAAEH